MAQDGAFYGRLEWSYAQYWVGYWPVDLACMMSFGSGPAVRLVMHVSVILLHVHVPRYIHVFENTSRARDWLLTIYTCILEIFDYGSKLLDQVIENYYTSNK